jgi:hypothetical protein
MNYRVRLFLIFGFILFVAYVIPYFLGHIILKMSIYYILLIGSLAFIFGVIGAVIGIRASHKKGK